MKLHDTESILPIFAKCFFLGHIGGYGTIFEFLFLTNNISVSWEMEKYQAYHVKWDTPVGRAHIAYLISWDATYIFIGQLHLTSIGFKKKFNMVSEPITHLGQSPILGGCWKIPHRLPQFLGCSLYI